MKKRKYVVVLGFDPIEKRIEVHKAEQEVETGSVKTLEVMRMLAPRTAVCCALWWSDAADCEILLETRGVEMIFMDLARAAFLEDLVPARIGRNGARIGHNAAVFDEVTRQQMTPFVAASDPG